MQILNILFWTTLLTATCQTALIHGADVSEQFDAFDAINWFYRKEGLVWNIGKLSQDTDRIVLLQDQVNEIFGREIDLLEMDDTDAYVAFNICKRVTDNWGPDTYAAFHDGDECTSLTGPNNRLNVSILPNNGLMLSYR